MKLEGKADKDAMGFTMVGPQITITKFAGL
jgi:hypothetical protein